MTYNAPPTQKQIDFLHSLQRQLHLSNSALDSLCVRQFGHPFAAMDRSEVSQLLEEMQTWRDIPADLRRAMGQMDLFGEKVSP